MRRLTLALFALALLGNPGAGFAGDLRRDFERELAAGGFATDDAGLRELVRTGAAPEEARSKAAMLLGYRGVKGAGEEIAATLTEGLSPEGRAAMATALIYLDPVRFEAAIVEVAGQLDLRNRTFLAASLADQGRVALYPALIEALDAGDWLTPHTALAALVHLAKNPPGAVLDPDPFGVIVREVNPQRAARPLLPSTAPANRPAAERVRLEAARAVPEVLCPASPTSAPIQESRAVPALEALGRAEAGDPEGELQEVASAGLNSLALGLLTGIWPPYCTDLADVPRVRLWVSGPSVDLASLRARLKDAGAKPDDRLDAARYLAQRGDASALPDFRLALRSTDLPEGDLGVLAHYFLRLAGADAPGAVEAVVETANRLKQPSLRLYLAQDLALRGQPALYEVLVAGLGQGSSIERFFALRGVAALAARTEPGKTVLKPDPAKSLIAQLSSGEAALRGLAARGLGAARYASNELRREAEGALAKVAEGDAVAEVKREAAESLQAIRERPRDPKPGGER